jgi:hypothetical protein
MLPELIRVAAIDDVEDHLQKIVWGLGKAGFCPIPYLFEDGKLEHPPAKPIPGIRLVFSDIHMVPGGTTNEKTHAANIIRCLKAIVGNGPYALIFWSQFPGDVERMRQLIEERALGAGVTLPLGYGRIDKNAVFKISDDAKSDDYFDVKKLRELILAEVADFHTLGIAASWDSRVADAAARATNQLFELAGTNADRAITWDRLLAFLAIEAAGWTQAKLNVKNALDAAMLPLLEDQLTLIGHESEDKPQLTSKIMAILNEGDRPKIPPTVSVNQLNTRYLIEELLSTTQHKMWDRGVVTQLGAEFIGSPDFVKAFGTEQRLLSKDGEFFFSELEAEEKSRVKLYIVEAGPECDHVQGKIATHRYILAALVPASVFAKRCYEKKRERYRNASILDSGPLSISGHDEGHHLLISCRCFMALAPGKAVNGQPSFRLRKDFLSEVMHHYTTHARRPGVMRFG